MSTLLTRFPRAGLLPNIAWMRFLTALRGVEDNPEAEVSILAARDYYPSTASEMEEEYSKEEIENFKRWHARTQPGQTLYHWFLWAEYGKYGKNQTEATMVYVLENKNTRNDYSHVMCEHTVYNGNLSILIKEIAHYLECQELRYSPEQPPPKPQNLVGGLIPTKNKF